MLNKSLEMRHLAIFICCFTCELFEKIDKLHAAGWSVAIQWIPGHEGAEGNERADDAAKEAARMAAARTRQAEPLTDRAVSSLGCFTNFTPSAESGRWRMAS
jgi:RNase H-like protein